MQAITIINDLPQERIDQLNRIEANQEMILKLLTTGDPAKNWLKGPEVEKKLMACRATLRNWRNKGLLVYDEARRRYREDSVIEMQKKLHIKADVQ